MTELIVAATLLVSALGTAVPLAVSARRIQRQAHHYHLGIEELSNQLDRLRSLDAVERESALAELAPSEEIRELLDDVTLQGAALRDADGTRLVLTLQWRRPIAAAPLRLVGWLDALPVDAAAESSQPSEELQ